MVFSATVFLLSVIGGALAELLKWYQLRESPNLPVYAKNPTYWIITLLMVVAGGVLALAQGVDASKPLLALNIGISAPLILKALAATVPPTQPAAKDLSGPTPSVANFVAGR